MLVRFSEVIDVFEAVALTDASSSSGETQILRGRSLWEPISVVEVNACAWGMVANPEYLTTWEY